MTVVVHGDTVMIEWSTERLLLEFFYIRDVSMIDRKSEDFVSEYKIMTNNEPFCHQNNDTSKYSKMLIAIE